MLLTAGEPEHTDHGTVLGIGALTSIAEITHDGAEEAFPYVKGGNLLKTFWLTWVNARRSHTPLTA